MQALVLPIGPMAPEPLAGVATTVPVES